MLTRRQNVTSDINDKNEFTKHYIFKTKSLDWTQSRDFVSLRQLGNYMLFTVRKHLVYVIQGGDFFG